MKYASDDLTDMDGISSSFEVIRSKRMDKLRSSLFLIDENSATVGFRNVGCTELILVRDAIVKIFDAITEMSNTVDKLSNVDYSHNLRNVYIESQYE